MFDNRLDVLSPATAAQQDDAYDLATTGRAAAARPGRACCRRYYHPCPEDPRGGGEGPEGNRRARTVLVALVVPFALFWAGAGYLGVADGPLEAPAPSPLRHERLDLGHELVGDR